MLLLTWTVSDYGQNLSAASSKRITSVANFQNDISRVDDLLELFEVGLKWVLFRFVKAIMILKEQFINRDSHIKFIIDSPVLDLFQRDCHF